MTDQGSQTQALDRRIVILVDAELDEELRRRAHDEDRPIARVIREAIRAGLAKEDAA